MLLNALRGQNNLEPSGRRPFSIWRCRNAFATSKNKPPF